MCLGVPGRIVDVEGEEFDRRGRVDFVGVVRDVSLACVPEAGPGDWVLVHVGFAIATLDEAEALETLGYLSRIGELIDASPG